MTHDERVEYHMYTKPKIPAENAELIASLEELVLDMYDILDGAPSASYPDGSKVLTNLQLGVLFARMTELGVFES